MRPLDLLAFRIDDDQKNFIKEFHGEEKNFRISKQFELYTWGRSSEYNLGYPQLNEEKKRPKKVIFEQHQVQSKSFVNDLESVKDVKIADTFSLALSEDGKVYSWGSGLNGRLGHGDLDTQIAPKIIKLDLKDENKKIKQLKNRH